MTPAKPLTAQEMLTEIINAQVKGGYSEWKERLEDHCHCGYQLQLEKHPGDRRSLKGSYEDDEWRYGIIEILLDPEGLKAAYGSELACKNCGNPGRWTCANKDCWHPNAGVTSRGWAVAHMILLAWLAEGAEEAIRTAYELLP